jgi:membrane protease YdiL (CAAX protease family)
MNRIFAGVDVGRKNIGFGIVLFLILGVVVGIPLTVDLFGGSMLTESQYQTWKVLHAYGVFTAFVNFFFGYCIDRLSINKQQKEIASWSFLVAGLVGGIGRPVLFLLSSFGGIGSYTISLIETVGFVVGTFIFVRGQIKEHPAQLL